MDSTVDQDAGNVQRTPTNAWNLYVGRDICSNVQAGLDHEWLVTNGIGGYAGASIVGATTRNYHGLLVAAIPPPVERYVLVTKIDEEVMLPGGTLIKLGVNEYQDGTLDPHGNNYLDNVALEGDVPCFTYLLNKRLTLQKRVWMEYGQNTTYIQYSLHGSFDEEGKKKDQQITLTLFPFCLYRDYHSTTVGSENWRFIVDSQGNRCMVQAFADAPELALIAQPGAAFTPTGMWYWHVLHRRARERGLSDTEDVYQPGNFCVQIAPGMRLTLVLSCEPELPSDIGGAHHEDYAAQALTRHNRRVKQLLSVANPSIANLPQKDPALARLIVAADQFIVARPEQGDTSPINNAHLSLSPDRKTIIAGYPWFTDWGRDSMIALPGLLLHTGRFSEARGLLKAFASYTHNGLIPNRFPDRGEAPEYNTADATLWMFYALTNYLDVTGDWSLIKDLFPTLSDSISWHIRGTDYGIGMDPNDGLLRAGAPGVQLTWMDAKVGDRVITPRWGKPVEVNALWYCALTCMENWAVRLSIDASEYSSLRERVRQHFVARFWYDPGGYLYDVVDVQGKVGENDSSLRPNQLFAASLTRDLLSEAQIQSMFQHVTDHLLTPLGLRSLSPDDPNYHKHFNGPPEQRDEAYHQGTVWLWLIGPYIDVHLRLHNDRAAAQALLRPFVNHLWDACLGTFSEVTEPEPPYTPAGCFAQAWSVAEVLRCWKMLAA
jgi:predicted glycogen debranching enzyme